MIFSTATVPVNPSGARPLTRDQVWAGLVRKARDARLFLPPGACTKCEVVAEGTDFTVREAVIMNDELTEIITFAPNRAGMSDGNCSSARPRRGRALPHAVWWAG